LYVAVLGGFIDFIVEPSFQVMSDVIDKILEPMQQQDRHRPMPFTNSSTQHPQPPANQQGQSTASTFCVSIRFCSVL